VGAFVHSSQFVFLSIWRGCLCSQLAFWQLKLVFFRLTNWRGCLCSQLAICLDCQFGVGACVHSSQIDHFCLQSVRSTNWRGCLCAQLAICHVCQFGVGACVHSSQFDLRILPSWLFVCMLNPVTKGGRHLFFVMKRCQPGVKYRYWCRGLPGSDESLHHCCIWTKHRVFCLFLKGIRSGANLRHHRAFEDPARLFLDASLHLHDMCLVLFSVFSHQGDIGTVVQFVSCFVFVFSQMRWHLSVLPVGRHRHFVQYVFNNRYHGSGPSAMFSTN